MSVKSVEPEDYIQPGQLGYVVDPEPAPGHTCHAEGCRRIVPEALLMCYPHWKLVPHTLKREVWAAYRRGQETRKDPSPEYLEAARRAINAVARKEGRG